MDEARFYELHNGDIFSVGLDIFMSESSLWVAPFRIVGFDKYKRKWWQIWKPKWTYYVKIKFLGYEVK